MAENQDPRFTISSIKERYNNPKWFSLIDAWHQYTANKIFYEVTEFLNYLSNDSKYIIINVGAGGNDFGLKISTVINLDISEVRISHMCNPVVGSAESLPIADNSVDFIICVGSVINYCDAAPVIAEARRVMRTGGILILEFESSYSAELVAQSAFRQSAAIAETFYADRDEAVWVYSPTYMRNLLHAARFSILKSVPIHILSPWALLLLRSARVSTVIAPVDYLAEKFAFLSQWASNHLIFCEKKI